MAAAAASPHGPLTVQTDSGPPLTPGGPAYPGHYAPHHLLPPSAFASAGPALQDPAIMSMVPGVTPVPPAMVGNLVAGGVKPPPFPPQPNFPPTQQPGLHQQHHQAGQQHQPLHHQQPAAPRQAGFSP